MLTFTFKPFQRFIQTHDSIVVQSRYSDSRILDFELTKGRIDAFVQGTGTYKVSIDYDEEDINVVLCSCNLNAECCEHVVAVLVHADSYLYRNEVPEKANTKRSLNLIRIDRRYIIEDEQVLMLDLEGLDEISLSANRFNTRYYTRIERAIILPNHFSGVLNNYIESCEFRILQRDEKIIMDCSCSNEDQSLCGHLNFLLNEINTVLDLQLPFNAAYRNNRLQQKALELGVKDVTNLDEMFSIQLDKGRLFIAPKFNILTLNKESKTLLKSELVPDFNFPKAETIITFKEFLVFSTNMHDDRVEISWMNAPLSKAGTLKTPITAVNVLDLMSTSIPQNHFSFYKSLISQRVSGVEFNIYDYLNRLKYILDNPLKLPIYYFDVQNSWSQKLTPKNIVPLEIICSDCFAKIFVKQQNDYYVLTCSVRIDNNDFQSKHINLIGYFFLWNGRKLNFIGDLTIIRVIKFFRENKDEIFIHSSQFHEFQEDFLNRLNGPISIHYEFVKSAPKGVVKKQKLNLISEYMIYLSESEDYILITPVMVYGETEIAIRTNQQIYTENPAGGLFVVERDQTAEHQFLKEIQSQHSAFLEQVDTDFFYLHKQEFLDDAWFLDAFEYWRSLNFSILGFNQLKNNRMNANKMSVRTNVSSGIDWFEVRADVKFGDQAVSLKEIRKAVLNKNKYIKLGDGTLGLMPTEWIEKFGSYFRSGEINGDFLKIDQSNFKIIDELFSKDVLTHEANRQLALYMDKLQSFESIDTINVSKHLTATLRDYQKEGLNWLNFLDEFGFGGCLADDMGLGKTIQIISYLLSQKEKNRQAANLVVVPTSLLFNWQHELNKFAPTLRYHVLYGVDRNISSVDFKTFDLILTTYGTMLYDIEVLKEYEFNCIVLDESQAIKNPSSKRYKAARLLKARQRLVMTGTPIENNTFDLFAQLSFAVPGLLGNAKRFAEEYSTPIDKFQERKRAIELQQKIHPFILRRTKDQVAKELPEKTEMIIYCEMSMQQQRVYDAYKDEIRMLIEGDRGESLGNASMHILRGLTKLRQICNSPALLSDDEFYGEESSKLSELMDQIVRLKENHKILVFSQFVEMLELVRKKLATEQIPYSYLTGKTKNRQEVVNEFQNNADIRVFLISLKAGGTGLNLTEADYVFLIDPWWNPAVENQAIDRAYRIGQDKKVIAVRLITPGTIEEKIMELQSRKKQLATDLIQTDANILKSLSKEDLLQLL